MDSKSSAFHIYRQTLIKRNTVPVNQIYQYEQKDKLGQGNYGVVYKAIHKISKQVRALKVISKKNIKYKERLLNEITIMEQMDHPNILRLFETFEDGDNLYMILEICGGGDVFDKVLEKGNMSIEESFKIYVQYMRAVNYYQGFGIAHRDLKPENFLFQKKDDINTLTVIDFGIAKKVHEKLKTKSGTAYYVAPEVLEGSYDARCDIWSAGVILYVILCGYPPFYGENEKEILQEIRSGSLQFDGDEWSNVPQEIKDFIKLHICSVEKRAGPKELLASKLIESFIMKQKQDVKILFMQNINSWVRFHPLKRLALLYLATQMDSADLKSQKIAFFQVNTSQSGLITQQELATYLKVDKKEISKVWTYLDSNFNGFVDYFEFVALTLTPQDYQKNLQMMFDFLSQGGKHITLKTIQQIFDQNGNLNHKWDSIAENKAQPHIHHEQQVNVKSMIDKDLDFSSFKQLMG